MELTLPLLHAMLHCPYKAWQLSRDITVPLRQGSIPQTAKLRNERLVTMAWSLEQGESLPREYNHRTSKLTKDAEVLLSKTKECILNEAPPPFHLIPHCSECPFKESCYQKLREKDCISLLAGMTPKVVEKYHKKGITTITQLSYLFRPRRSQRSLQTSGRHMWELKALALREQKTFVIQRPNIVKDSTAIYLDFEGLPDEQFHYLLGCVVIVDGRSPERYSFWANNSFEEGECLRKLLTLLAQYPVAPIYHYGSYEPKALKRAAQLWIEDYATVLKAIEPRMVNILTYLRTHVYPPIYGNGLKEVGRFLGFEWTDPNATGIDSIEWRREWERTKAPEWKEKLIQYNFDDCLALHTLHGWLSDLAQDDTPIQQPEKVQLVSEMKRHTPYRLRSNVEFGEDFQVINKAAYFDYQRDKIYFRNRSGGNKLSPTFLQNISRKKAKKGRKGIPRYRPKRINEVIVRPMLEVCPHCGGHDLQFLWLTTSIKRIDLKFTSSGIRRHVIQYRLPISKCHTCERRVATKNSRLHYGDNLFALVIHYYVNYHLSSGKICSLLEEQYGVRMGRQYLVTAKNKWWNIMWAPDAEYLREIVLNSPVINIDETTIPLKKGSGYVWVFATSHSVFYHYTPTRNSDFLRELLKGYKGIIVSDFYPGYETLNVTRQKCLIHLIRDLNDDLFKVPYDEEYRDMVSAFGKLLRGIIETIDRYGLQKVYLEKHSDEVESYYQAFVATDHRSELSIKCAKRLKKHWNELWTFIHHDDVPWNNNNAENAVKAFAQHRRGVKGMMRETGLSEYLQMLSVAQTCRYRNLSFLEYLRCKSGIWKNIPPSLLPGYLPFLQARQFARNLKFQKQSQWNVWKKSELRPPFLPQNPRQFYRYKGWISWNDWLNGK